jgi:hypothetical protein
MAAQPPPPNIRQQIPVVKMDNQSEQQKELPNLSPVVTVGIRNGGLELLPHWFRYYRQQLGPARFCLTIIGDATRLSAVEEIASEFFPCPYSQIYINVCDGELHEGHGDQIQSLHTLGLNDQDWIVWTDLDELHWFGNNCTIRQALAAADREGRKAIFGYFVDRTSPDGSLNPVEKTPCLWSQFPVESNFSRHCLRAYQDKVVAAKWGMNVTGGHHEIRGYRRHPPYAQVHHFKWTKGIRERVDHWMRSESRHPNWVKECEALFRHLDENGGKIKV